MKFSNSPARGGHQGDSDVVIARVVKARGIKGEVACDIVTDFPERFQSLQTVGLKMPGGLRIEMEVEDCWFHKDRVVVKFRGCDTMSAAERLAGASLVIDEAEAAPLGKDQFYEFDLIGSEVVTLEGCSLGKVVRLLRTGGTDVIVIGKPGGGETLIPFADHICVGVDSELGRITVNPPPGLLEL